MNVKTSPGTPIILVGTKKDLRGDADVKENLSQKGMKMIEISQGDQMANQISNR